MPTPSPDIVVSDHLTWPNALALSRDGSKLYFGDAAQDYIAYYSFESKKVVRLRSTTHVFAMDEYMGNDGESRLFWSDWVDGVFKMPVTGGTTGAVQLASTNDVHSPSGMKVFTWG